MTQPKIAVIPGSIRTGSYNTRLAAVITRQLNQLGAQAQLISLADYPMPILNQDDEAENGAPESARQLAALLGEQQGVVLVNPEYNGSFSGLMKNTLDWLSRDVGVKVYQDRVFALAACSPGMLGGIRVLSHARDNLVSVGADMITTQLAVGGAAKAFGDDDTLINERAAGLLQKLCESLIDRARTYI
ncbi:MAG: NAD(P)H-dependent oxidoreductase [Rhizobiaceae bacterium]